MQRTTDLTATRGAAGPQSARPEPARPEPAGPEFVGDRFADLPSADTRPGEILSPPVPTPPERPLPAGHLVLPEGRRIYAVGDVHGCLRELLALEAAILADAADAEHGATIVMLGDYVDRGPDSAGAVHHLAGPPPPGLERICLRGNHDDYLLGFLADPAAHLGWLDVDGRGTLASYGLAVPRKVTPATAAAVREAAVRAIPPAHVAFLQGLPLLARADGFVFVHAGLRPGVPLEAQDPADLLLMGDWHLDRRSGDLPFRVVHGHTVRFAPLVDERRVAVDTGAFRTGRLTAARIEGGAVTFLDSTGRVSRPLRGGHPPLRAASWRPDAPAAGLPSSALPAAPSAAAMPPVMPSPRVPTRTLTRAFAASVAGIALFGLAGSLLAANWTGTAPPTEAAADGRPPTRPAAATSAPFRSLEQDLEAALDGLRDPVRPSSAAPTPGLAHRRPEPTGSVAPSALAALEASSAPAALIDEALPPSRPEHDRLARVVPDRDSALGDALAALPVDPPEAERPSGLPGRVRPIVPAEAALVGNDRPDPAPALAVPVPRPRPAAGPPSLSEPALPETDPSGRVLPGVIASLAGDNPLDTDTPRVQAFGFALSACCGGPVAPPAAPAAETPPPGRGGTATTGRTAAAESAVTNRKPAVRSAKRAKRPRRLRQRVVRRPALDFAVDDDRPAWVIHRDRARSSSAATAPASDGFATRPGTRSSGASAGRSSGPANASGTGGRETASGGSASGATTAGGGGGGSGTSTGATASAGSTAGASASAGSSGTASGGSSSAGTASGSPSGGSTSSGPVGSAVGGVAGGVSSVGEAVGRGLGGVGRAAGGALGGRGRGGDASEDGGRGGSKGDGGRGEGGRGEGGRGEGGRGEGGRGGGRGRD